MKKPKIITIPLFEDLTSSPEQSQLKKLAEKEKEGKIKIWPGGIIHSPLSPGWVVVIYDELETKD